jgi:hypothetical protein
MGPTQRRRSGKRPKKSRAGPPYLPVYGHVVCRRIWRLLTVGKRMWIQAARKFWSKDDFDNATKPLTSWTSRALRGSDLNGEWGFLVCRICIPGGHHVEY